MNESEAKMLSILFNEGVFITEFEQVSIGEASTTSGELLEPTASVQTELAIEPDAQASVATQVAEQAPEIKVSRGNSDGNILVLCSSLDDPDHSEMLVNMFRNKKIDVWNKVGIAELNPGNYTLPKGKLAVINFGVMKNLPGNKYAVERKGVTFTINADEIEIFAAGTEMKKQLWTQLLQIIK